MLPRHSPKQNRILAALTGASYTRLLPLLEFVPMPAGQVVYEPGPAIRYFYFPTTCIVMRLYETRGGACTQTGITGYEGMVGISSLFGGERNPVRVIVQSSGHAYRIKTDLLRTEFNTEEQLRNLLLRYAHALMVQTEQTAVSNRYHTVDQQLGYLLLLSLDRLSGNELRITHEQAGIMIGVRRESVTVAAHRLQAAGAIRYRRGHLTVVDRQQLEAIAGENYEVVRKEYDSLAGFYSSLADGSRNSQLPAHYQRLFQSAR